MANIADVFSHIYTTEMNLNSVPTKNGQIILCVDSGKLYIDHNTTRIETTDIIKVENEAALPLAPLDKIYMAQDSGKLYISFDNLWHVIATDVDINDAVRRYQATVDNETGTVSITDGTPVEDVRIGDEIVTPNGVYQKVKDGITTTGPADGSRIEVSGITSPAEVNGAYILTETENVWKHESADYWISSWNNAYYWMISAVDNAANPGSSLFYGYTASPSMPWEVTSWTSSSGATGTPVLENVASEQTVTDTIDLFEYASLPVKPENIVQSVNGNKPDASGNVTIETSSGGLTSVSVGNGLTGNGTSSAPVALDLSNYTGALNVTATSNAVIRGGTSGNYDITIGDSSHGVTVYAAQNNSTVSITSFGSTGNIDLNSANINVGGSSGSTKITLRSSNVSVEPTTGGGTFSVDVTSSGSVKFTAGSIYFNDNASNTAGGFAIVDDDGKLPSSILPESTIDLSNYEAPGAISLNAAISGAALHLDSTGAQLEGDNSVTIQSGNGIHLREVTGLYLNEAGLNQPEGLAQLGPDGKLPVSIIPSTSPSWTKQTISQSNFSTDDSTYGGKYMELDGICSVEVYAADGYKVEFDVKCDCTGNKTRV